MSRQMENKEINWSDEHIAKRPDQLGSLAVQLGTVCYIVTLSAVIIFIDNITK